MEQNTVTDQYHTLVSYLLHIMYQAKFYHQDEGWEVIERLGFIDLLMRRNEFESNPNFEIIFGEGDYDTLSILSHCEKFFEDRRYSRQIFFHRDTPTVERNMSIVDHIACECGLIVMGDDDTQTLCTVTKMKRSGIFYIVTKTSEKE